MNLHFRKTSKELLTQDLCLKYGIVNHSLSAAYYQEYYGDSFQDLSFLILCEGVTIGHVWCNILSNKLCNSGDGIFINIDESIDSKMKIYREVIDHLKLLAQENHCTEIVIKDTFCEGKMSFIGEILFNERYKSTLNFEMKINYIDFSEDVYHRSVRKSYKSLLNWGKKKLDIFYVNNQNMCKESFNKFQQFHQRIAGRKTRSDDSWRIQLQMLADGFGELILAYLDGQLVASSLFVDINNSSIYFTGVYERELFDFGLSHYLTYQGICRSKLRGNSTSFSLGYFDNQIEDSKLYNIQFFKKGFCGKFISCILWSKTIDER